jgi:transcriptional regulator with XRE-family HTH domain
MHFPRLKELRKQHNLTQQQVAQILSCNRNVYRRYETGEREIPTSYAVVLSRYYSVSLDYLLELK